MVFLLLLAADPALGTNRGIPINLGDSVSTAITPGGDKDTFVFDAFAGSKLTVLVSPTRGSGLLPTIEVLDPGGSALDLSGFGKQRNQKITVKKLLLPVTGLYAIRIGGAGDSEGAYQMKTRGAPVKKLSMKGVAIAPGGSIEVLFPGKTDTKVVMTVKAKGIQFAATSVHDPAGTEIPGAVEMFRAKKSSLKADLYMVGRLGDYGVTFGNASATGTLDITAKFQHPKIARRKLEISPLEPIVDHLEPDFGRPGAKVRIMGENFQDGNLVVLIGENPAKFPEFEKTTEISLQMPEGEGIADITVFNPDGQEGILKAGWTYIAPPPAITTLTPTEGPDGGGTVIDVFGESFTFVTRIELGGSTISTPIEIVDERHLRFTTDPHAPGFATLVVQDQWAQTGSRVAAFRFVSPPTLNSLTPLAGTKKGGTTVTLIGANLRSDDKVFIDGTAVTPVTFLGTTKLEVRAPAHANAVVSVWVTDPWGRSTPGLNFEYNDGNFFNFTSTNAPKNEDPDHFGATAVVLGDVDGINSRDILLGSKKGNLSSAVRVLLNNKYGSFMSTSTAGDSFDADDLALGDLDGDGDLDLVITMDGVYSKRSVYYYSNSKSYWTYNVPYASTRVHLNDGKGTFTFAASAFPNPRKTKNTDVLQGVALALGDLDGDSDLDLVITRGKNVASSDWSTYSYSWSGYYYYYKYFYKKYDTSKPSTRILLNNGKGVFTNVGKANMPAVSGGDMFAGDDVLLGDIDGDKDLDLIITGDGSRLRDSKKVEYVSGSKTRILKNNGKAVFTNATGTLFPAPKTGDDWGGTTLAFGDLDSDGKKDLAVGLGRSVSYTDAGGTKHLSSTRVFSGGTGGKFTESTGNVLPAVRPDGQGEMWKAVGVAIADPDGNGKFDLFLVNRAAVMVLNPATGNYDKQVSSTRWLFNVGSSPLKNITAKSVPDPAIGGDYFLGDTIVLGDVDRDGDLDLVISTMLAGYTGVGQQPTRVLLFD